MNADFPILPLIFPSYPCPASQLWTFRQQLIINRNYVDLSWTIVIGVIVSGLSGCIILIYLTYFILMEVCKALQKASSQDLYPRAEGRVENVIWVDFFL